jgi:hypothetical protein
MKKTIGPAPDNMLNDLYLRLMQFPIFFRDKVGEECLWSTPTFYRKIKEGSALSNAEREKIMSVFDESFEELWDYLKKYRRSPNK